jgi:hypothetical protein
MDEILIDDDNDENNTNTSSLNQSDINRTSDLNDINMSTSLTNIVPVNNELVIGSVPATSEASVKKIMYKCETCSKTFNKVYNYKRHIFSHKSRESNYRVRTKQFQINQCSNCKRRIIDKSNFVKHVKICKQKQLKQRFEKAFESQNTIVELIQIDASPIDDDQLDNKCKKVELECELCHKIFNRKFNFHRHLRMHFLNEILNHQHDPINTNKKFYLESKAIMFFCYDRLEFDLF